MIGVVAKLSIQPGKEAEFEQTGRDLMAKVKANEPGCLTYQLYKISFINLELGYGAAMSFYLLALILAVTLSLYFFWGRREARDA